jgi:hypothetical protein
MAGTKTTGWRSQTDWVVLREQREGGVANCKMGKQNPDLAVVEALAGAVNKVQFPSVFKLEWAIAWQDGFSSHAALQPVNVSPD